MTHNTTLDLISYLGVPDGPLPDLESAMRLRLKLEKERKELSPASLQRKFGLTYSTITMVASGIHTKQAEPYNDVLQDCIAEYRRIGDIKHRLRDGELIRVFGCLKNDIRKAYKRVTRGGQV